MIEFIPGLLVFLLILGLMAGLYIIIQMQLAKYRAIRDRKDEVSLFGGLVRLLLWEPNEGLVILKYKQISEVIPFGEVALAQQGGMKFISTLRGEELRARIPLAPQMMTWEDQNILTRESIQVRMKVAVWWNVRDLSAYVFGINKGIHVELTHQKLNLVEAAEAWLKTITESTIRTLISQASTAFLVSSKATSYLQVANRHDGGTTLSSAPESGTPEAIAGHLCQALSQKVREYGLDVQRVEIQAVNFSANIQEAIDKVWQASLLPAQTEQEARAKVIELEALRGVIGIDATAMNELMKNFQGSTFYGQMPFLDSMFQNLSKPSDSKALTSGQSDKKQISAHVQPQSSEDEDEGTMSSIRKRLNQQGQPAKNSPTALP